MSVRRRRKPWDRVGLIEDELLRWVKPANPDPQCWLTSDASDSYCYPCAREARARELRMIVTPPPVPWYARNEFDRWFEEEIDGGYPGQMPSDSPAFCATCGEMLAYDLTEAGIIDEVAAFLECEFTQITPAVAYMLDRLWDHGRSPEDNPKLVVSLIKIGRQALSVVRNSMPFSSKERVLKQHPGATINGSSDTGYVVCSREGRAMGRSQLARWAWENARLWLIANPETR